MGRCCIRRLFIAVWVSFLFFSVCSSALAKKNFELDIFEVFNFVKEYDTYEDVNDIEFGYKEFLGDALSKNQLDDFKKPVSQEDGEKLIERIKKTGGLIYLKDNDLKKFIKNNFYMDGGRHDKKTKKWLSKKFSGLPFYIPAIDTIYPGYEDYSLCFKGGWKYVLPFSYSPDGISCKVDTKLCQFPPCDLIDNNGYKNGDNKDCRVIEHHQTTPNVYKNLKSVVDASMQVAKGLHGYRHGKGKGGAAGTVDNFSLRINMKDRTPPRILGCVDGMFPELGKYCPATTGDWYKISGLRILDNGSSFVGTCLCLGKIDQYPSKNWTSEEDWVKEPPRKLMSGDEAEYVILPNMCQGAMRYSIFTWDEDGLLNPGEPMIEEDLPEICYGLRFPPIIDLLKDPKLAKPWPLRVTCNGDVHKINPDDIKPGDRRGEGYVHIVDNDLPNILIRFESVKDGRRIFFPPPIQPGVLPVLSSGDYKKSSGETDKNAKDYEEFVGLAGGTVFTSDLAAKTKPLYFKILDVKPSAVMVPEELSTLNKFKNPLQESFIRSQFRLEDYNESDTTIDGDVIKSALATYGKRNSYGKEVTAILEIPLQEDVAYNVSFWADDNVKWATMETGKILDKIIPIPTGIVDGEYKIEISNQYPSVSHKGKFDPDSSYTKNQEVVFREPTITGSSSSILFYEKNKFPSVEVFATDFAGHTRKIKLFLRVSNENPNIRIIERQHEKK